jgi:hypothetical protein
MPLAPTLLERIAEAAQKNQKPVVIPASYVDFCAWLGVVLTDGQRVASLVAYDGIEPKDLAPADRELARQLFGNIDVIPTNARDVVVAVCGGRAGKTYILESLRLLHLALTVPLNMAPGEVASAPIIQPDLDLAEQALNYVMGALESKPALAAMVTDRHKGKSVDVTRADGSTVEIVCRAASAKGRTGRGRTLVGFALGEAAFFRDADSGQVNDQDIFDALTVRVVEGGQGIVSSTPFAMAGLLYNLFVANHPDPSVAGIVAAVEDDEAAEDIEDADIPEALAIHAPSLVLRDNDAKLARMVAKAYRRNATNASREYGALFMSAGTSLMFDANSLNAAIRKTVLPLTPQPGDRVSAGGDTGFEKNSSTLVVVHQRTAPVLDANGKQAVSEKGTPKTQQRYLTAEIYEKKPEGGVPLKPSLVVKDFAEVMGRHGCKYFLADGHYRATVLEHLAGTGITFVDAPSTPADAFVRANALLREGLVDVPNDKRLVRQLRETLKRPKPGGGMSVILPKWKSGEHGDLAAAWVLAVYQAWGQKVPDAVAETGTQAWEDHERDRRSRAMKAKAEKKKDWWR